MNPKPLTPEEVQKAAEQFFPLFDIINHRMPPGSTIEDALKVMETVCNLAQKLRLEEEKSEFGFNKNKQTSET